MPEVFKKFLRSLSDTDAHELYDWVKNGIPVRTDICDELYDSHPDVEFESE